VATERIEMSADTHRRLQGLQNTVTGSPDSALVVAYFQVLFEWAGSAALVDDRVWDAVDRLNSPDAAAVLLRMVSNDTLNLGGSAYTFTIRQVAVTNISTLGVLPTTSPGPLSEAAADTSKLEEEDTNIVVVVAVVMVVFVCLCGWFSWCMWASGFTLHQRTSTANHFLNNERNAEDTCDLPMADVADVQRV